MIALFSMIVFLGEFATSLKPALSSIWAGITIASLSLANSITCSTLSFDCTSFAKRSLSIPVFIKKSFTSEEPLSVSNNTNK